MGPFDFTCECAAGYTGTTCEVDIDDCLTAVCPVNSRCVDAINSYTCVCNPGFGGDQCILIAQGEQGNIYLERKLDLTNLHLQVPLMKHN